MSDWKISSQAAALHQDALIWDMTLPWRVADWLTPTRSDLKLGCLERYAQSGIDFVSLTIATDEDDATATLRALAAERGYFKGNADKFLLVDKADDISKARTENKLAVGFHFQGTVPVGRDLKLIESYHHLGVRHMLMAYNQKNFVGDGCHERTDSGLSIFGLRLIEEMNRMGMLVDCAHTGYQTSMEALEASKAPVIFSHTNAKGVYDHPRCIADDQIKACAAKGGVMGMTGLSIFHGKGLEPVDGIVQHIGYVADLVGPEHVGLGSDYVYDMPALQGLAQTMSDKWPKSGGYTDAEIQ